MEKRPKSYNQRKREWFASVSEPSMLRMLRGQGILSWLDIYKVDQRIIAALEYDILEFVNRACRIEQIKKLK